MPKTNYPLQKEKIKISAEECFKLGELKGYFVLDGNEIKYTAVGKSYNFSDPEEKTRMMFYFDLVEKYKYPVDKIEFEVGMSGDETVDKYADIVVFTNDKQRKPYIVVKCEGSEISNIDFEQAVKKVIANAWNLGALFAVCVAGDKYRVVEIDEENNKTEISDIPVCYGENFNFN